VDFAQGLEAESVVDADGSVVGGDHMQDGAGVETALMVQDVGSKGSTIALPAIVGMRANAADLAGGMEDQPLARHGDELAGLPDESAHVKGEIARADSMAGKEDCSGKAIWRQGVMPR
jgi:hypothetical protein